MLATSTRPWITALCATLGACAVPEPAPVPPTALGTPERWSASPASPGEVQNAWWRSFGDATLDALVAEAQARNRNLRTAAERVARAEAQARIAGASLSPSLRASLEAGRSKEVFVGLPIPGGPKVLSSRSTSHGVSLATSWELDLWGKLRAGSRAAQADLARSVETFAAARLSLAAQTCRAWFALAESHAQVELSGKTVESYRQTLERVEERYAKGLRPALHVRLTKVDLLRATAELRARERVGDLVRRQCELLLGRYPEAELVAGSLPALPPTPPAGLPAALVDRRPDLRAARHALEAAHYRGAEARASLYPQISLTASTGTRSSELADLVDGDFSVWRLLGNLVQPIFEGGRLRAAVDAAEAGRREALAHFADLALRAFGEVEIALAAERLLASQRDATDTLLTEARAARDLAEERYAAGRSDILERLSLERSVFAAESARLELWRRSLDQRVDLHLAIGGGFAQDSRRDK